jgi:hypothetical protein
MLEVVLMAALLITVVAFMVYDRFMDARKLANASRDGFTPGSGIPRWVAVGTMALVCFGMATVEFLEPHNQAPPSRLLIQLVVQLFGLYGPFGLWAALGLAFSVLAALWHPRRAARSKTTE